MTVCFAAKFGSCHMYLACNLNNICYGSWHLCLCSSIAYCDLEEGNASSIFFFWFSVNKLWSFLLLVDLYLSRVGYLVENYPMKATMPLRVL